MNPWTALLESLHSALIDELTDRHPEPKPELGLPLRRTSYSWPSPDVTELLVCEIVQGESRGVGFVGYGPKCEKLLKIKPHALWDALMKRAGTEFGRRGITPKLAGSKDLPAGTHQLPKGFPEPQRVIWIPVKLGDTACFLGMGV